MTTQPSAEGRTRRQMWSLALPMILSNLSIPLLGMVDTVVIGHLPGPEYLGGVAVSSVIFSFIYWSFGFLRMSTTGFIAQALGSGSSQGVQTRLIQAALLALMIAATLLLAQGGIGWVAFAVLDASEAVTAQARAYFDIRIWGAPASLLSSVLIGWFLGLQNARAPLAIMLSANLCNIALDVYFVPILGWGVPGVAVASVCGEYLGLAVGLALALRAGQLKAPWRWLEVFDLVTLADMFKVNRDILLRTLCLVFALAFFTQQGAAMGELVLAANAVLLNFQHFLSYGLDGFAHAAEAMVGRAVGADDRAALSRVLRLTGRWSLGVALLYALLYWLGGPWLIQAMTDIEAVRSLAYEYLPWLILSPLVSVWSFWLDGVFIGATRAQEMRNSMLLATFGAYLPAWWLLRDWGNHGLWAALIVFLAVRGITLLWRLKYPRRSNRKGALPKRA